MEEVGRQGSHGAGGGAGFGLVARSSVGLNDIVREDPLNSHFVAGSPKHPSLLENMS